MEQLYAASYTRPLPRLMSGGGYILETTVNVKKMHSFSVLSLLTPKKSKVTLYFSSALGIRNKDLVVSWSTDSSLMCSTRVPDL